MRRRFAGHWTNPGSPPIGAPLMKKTKIPLWGIFLFFVVIPVGVEPTIFWMRTRRPGPLDDGTTAIILTESKLFCKQR